MIRPAYAQGSGLLFFFSSRRRHTRYWRDWSSDVCSSDLVIQAWYDALNDAQTAFRLLLTSTSSPDWKRVPLPRESISLASKGKGRSSLPELSDVIVHRRSAKSEDTVYRVVLDVPTADETIPFDVWKSIFATPELRQEW